jgi:hypothetical protein
MPNLEQRTGPSNKLFYKKYHTCIELGPFSRYDLVKLTNFESTEYKTVQRYVYSGDSARGIVVSIYTNNSDIIKHVISNYKLIHIRQPLNEEHAQMLLNKDLNVIFREKLFYDKYKFKMSADRDWKTTSINEHHENVKVAKSWLYENHSKQYTRLVHIDSSWAYFPHERVPNVYTNDESFLMLFKLMFGSSFRLEINSVVTLNTFHTTKTIINE